MSDWRGELDAPHSLKQKIVLKTDNDKIKNQLLHVYPTLYRLKKYKKYDSFFIKHNYADAFNNTSTKSVQIPIQSEEINDYLQPYESYFTNIVHSPHDDDDESLVDDIPARKQF